ncbi:hypothetical protein KAI65_01040 [Candidatus Parcubacteria bacterium]|nr:hypothetical protein [Candidatus Parcubacteria bacterium]
MCIANLVEYKNFGWNFFTLSFFMVFFSLIAEAVGFLEQIKTIKIKNSHKALSLSMYLYFIFLFLSSLVYGAKIYSVLLMLNGLLFVFCSKIAYELIKRKGINKKEFLLFIFCFIAILLMIILPIKEIVFSVFMLGSIFALLLQVFEIFKEKSPGVVEIKLISIYFLTTLFFVWYAKITKDDLLILATVLTLFSLSIIILFWLYFYLKEKRGDDYESSISNTENRQKI